VLPINLTAFRTLRLIRIFKMFRVLRVVKLARHLGPLQRLILIIKHSARDMALVTGLLFLFIFM
jgi:hypothetical protein